LQLSQDRYTKIITLNYQENSRFFLFTDGLMDVMNNSSEPFGEEKIQEFVTNNGHLSINEFSTKLEAEILSHSEGRRYPDDITWFVIDAE
jgi:serine phosphatase RsbU (regulator of sigma subunit)